MAGEGGVWSLLGGEGRGHTRLKHLAVSGVQSWHLVTPSLWGTWGKSLALPEPYFLICGTALPSQPTPS